MGHYMNKDEVRHQKGELEQLQALPLRAKVLLSKTRIREWYDHFNGEVCVSFSGGKDSTALLHLVRSIYPDVPGLRRPRHSRGARLHRGAVGHGSADMGPTGVGGRSR